VHKNKNESSVKNGNFEIKMIRFTCARAERRVFVFDFFQKQKRIRVPRESANKIRTSSAGGDSHGCCTHNGMTHPYKNGPLGGLCVPWRSLRENGFLCAPATPREIELPHYSYHDTRPF